MSVMKQTLNNLVPISQFNKGKASQIFERLHTEKRLIVLKNNTPAAVILSPEEYSRMEEALGDFDLYAEAMDRLKKFEQSGEKGLSFEEFLTSIDVTEEDLANAEEPEFE